MTVKALFSWDQLKKQPEDFRIGAVISDGMWYSLPKWRKIARVSEESLNRWVEEHLADGTLVQSETGAKSYRFPLTSIQKWYDDNDLELGVQLIEFFPPRIWDGLTETEGFIEAPLREIGMMSFICANHVAEEITERLRGVARVREVDPGSYKAYCLDARYVKTVVDEVFAKHEEIYLGKTHSKAVLERRELVDFSPAFIHGMILFYKDFGKTLVKRTMETIRIFLPEAEDQEAQIIMWVIAAIEKFNEKDAVPFSGYLGAVLRIWPYDLTNTHLGKELSNFQRQRSKALKRLTLDGRDPREVSRKDLIREMDCDDLYFDTLEEKHKLWKEMKRADSITWDENNEEKMGENFISKERSQAVASTDARLAHQISLATIRTASSTELYEDAYTLISQIDAHDLNLLAIKEVSEDFIRVMGDELGIGNPQER